MLEFGLLRHVNPLLSVRLATLMYPMGAGLLAIADASMAAAFAVFHGVGNGILTIASFGTALVGAGQLPNCGRSSPDVQNAHQFRCETASPGKNSTPVRFTSS